FMVSSAEVHPNQRSAEVYPQLRGCSTRSAEVYPQLSKCSVELYLHQTGKPEMKQALIRGLLKTKPKT
ncbi:MAG: hypothetical protein KAX25_05395, partial [Dehalococcoidia bacterium]|nr:hypothetical protein [Dehalococcoidia bacterium]